MDRNEFEILSKSIRKKLLSVARDFALTTGIEADDVVQDVLLALWELFEQDYPIRDIDAFAIRMTKNVCVSHYRKARLETLSLEHDNYLGGIEASVLTDKDDLKIIKSYIYNSLTDTQKEYLHLRNDMGLTLDEIAKVTGKPKTSIKSTISSARKQMLNMIKKEL